jgi:hypothetical protein
MSVSLLAIARLIVGAGSSQTAALHESNILDSKSGSTQPGTYGHHLVAGNMFRPGGIGKNRTTFMDFRGEQTCNVGRAFFNRFIPHLTRSSAHMPRGATSRQCLSASPTFSAWFTAGSRNNHATR